MGERDDQRLLPVADVAHAAAEPTPAATSAAMEVKLRTVTGQTLVVHDVQDGMTTDDLKGLVERQHMVPSDLQRLIFNGRELQAGDVIKDAGIQAGSILHIAIRQQAPAAAAAAAAAAAGPLGTTAADGDASTRVVGVGSLTAGPANPFLMSMFIITGPDRREPVQDVHVPSTRLAYRVRTLAFTSAFLYLVLMMLSLTWAPFLLGSILGIYGASQRKPDWITIFAILEFISGILLTALAYALGTSGDSTSGAIAPIILMIAGFRFYVVSQGVRLLKELRHGPPLPTTIPRARPEPDRAPHLQTAHRV